MESYSFLIFSFLDNFLFVLYSILVLYLLVFSIASLKHTTMERGEPSLLRRIVVLLPAYREDSVIEESVQACLEQDYPKDKFDVVVISDQMQDSTNSRLLELPIRFIKIEFENPTKAKSLNFALDQLADYDIAVVLDADNLMETQFLSKINYAFDTGSVIAQAHRTAKNTNTNYAILDAVSEEVNNSIFRKGHVNLGLSAALIGSGMAFDFQYFKSLMKQVKVVGGFDKDLEHLVLWDGKKIDYIDDAFVYDEKIQVNAHFTKQRRRWMAAQFEHFVKYNSLFLKALFKGNFDFCDKVFQMVFPPRILILGGVILMMTFAVLVKNVDMHKWLFDLFLLGVSLFVATPKWLINRRLFKAIFSLPSIFMWMVLNLFNLKGANTQFIHTPHGKL
ncbi:MAG: glycosyltransferase [Bacteroidales bacterium]